MHRPGKVKNTAFEGLFEPNGWNINQMIAPEGRQLPPAYPGAIMRLRDRDPAAHVEAAAGGHSVPCKGIDLTGAGFHVTRSTPQQHLQRGRLHGSIA